jgi:hypothetical protein
VLSGHSGIFVDRAKFNIKNSVISDNLLTGISLVGRGAFSIIEDTHIFGNASAPIDSEPGKVELKGANVIKHNEASNIEESSS